MTLVLLAAALLAHSSPKSAEPLRSPWDDRKVTLTHTSYSCPAIVPLSPDLTTDRYYSDAKSSVVDPDKWKAYVASSGPYKELGQRIVDAADAYQTTGSRDAVDCVLRHMDAAAKDGVFTGKMSSNQAYYVQGWVMGAIAIAYLKVRDSGLIRPEQERRILPWMVTVVHQTTNYYDSRRKQGTGDSENNHLYWAGVEAASAGIAAHDSQLFNWGIAAYHIGVAEIEPDGTLPIEMKRGRRALHYHLFALAPLVYLAELGEVNGEHLYAERNYALKKLAALSAEGIMNNHFFEQAAGVSQDTPNGPPTAEQISWASIYVSRFPDQQISNLLAEAPSLSYMYLGGLPPDQPHPDNRSAK
jgi:poly(beta-D-mannuronate) lyase